jgi:hypothetical protein
MAQRARASKGDSTSRRKKAGARKPETVASVTQGFASHVSGTIVTVKQGSSITTNSEQLDLFQGIVGLSRSNTANFAAARAGVVLAGGTVAMEQSGAGVVTTQGTVSMDKSGAVLLCANEVKAENSGAIFLLSRNVRGSVKTLFGPQEALVVGGAAGLAAGLVIAIVRLLSGNKRRA